MKRFAVLMALILCVTIGGVFANWIYTEGATASVQDNVTFGMSAATSNTARGTFTVGNNNLTLHIDQAGQKDYKAVLQVSGAVEFTFKPSEDYNMQGFKATFELYTAVANILEYTYDGEAYAVDGEGKSNAILSTFDVRPQTLTFTDGDGDGVYTASVTGEQIAQLMQLNDFELPTYAAWEICNNQLMAFPKIAVKVVDATVVA